jgi:hypothetical protein
MYLSYFILFSRFFYTSYFSKKCGNKDEKEVSVDGTEEYYKLKANQSISKLFDILRNL